MTGLYSVSSVTGGTKLYSELAQHLFVQTKAPRFHHPSWLMDACTTQRQVSISLGSLQTEPRAGSNNVGGDTHVVGDDVGK